MLDSNGSDNQNQDQEPLWKRAESYTTQIVTGGGNPNSIVSRDRSGGIVFYSLHIAPDAAYRMLGRILGDSDLDELVMILARDCLPDQGTTLDSTATLAYWKRGEGWKVGIIEYSEDAQKAGMAVYLPLNWNNEFWGGALKREMTNHHVRRPYRPGEEPIKIWDYKGT